MQLSQLAQNAPAYFAGFGFQNRPQITCFNQEHKKKEVLYEKALKNIIGLFDISRSGDRFDIIVCR